MQKKARYGKRGLKKIPPARQTADAHPGHGRKGGTEAALPPRSFFRRKENKPSRGRALFHPSSHHRGEQDHPHPHCDLSETQEWSERRFDWLRARPFLPILVEGEGDLQAAIPVAKLYGSIPETITKGVKRRGECKNNVGAVYGNRTSIPRSDNRPLNAA